MYHETVGGLAVSKGNGRAFDPLSCLDAPVLRSPRIRPRSVEEEAEVPKVHSPARTVPPAHRNYE